MPITRKPKTFIQIILTIILAFIGIIFSLFSTNTFAYADEVNDLVQAEKETIQLQQDIENKHNEYLAQIQVVEQLKTNVTMAEEKLRQIETTLETKRNSLSDMVRNNYRNNTTVNLFSVIFESRSLDELIKSIDYMQRAQDATSDLIVQIRTLLEEQRNTTEKLKNLKNEAEQQANNLSIQEQQLNQTFTELQPKLEQLRMMLGSNLASLQGKDQLSSALNYLENVQGISDIQSRIIKAAYETPYAGNALCEAWVEQVYRNAGIEMPYMASAYEAFQVYCKSEDINTIPPGAMVMCSGSGLIYGHISICVASTPGTTSNTLIIDNEGSKRNTAVSMDEFLSWQTAPSATGKESGFWGWGYPDSLSQYFPQSE